jgi:hypothetical protein
MVRKLIITKVGEHLINEMMGPILAFGCKCRVHLFTEEVFEFVNLQISTFPISFQKNMGVTRFETLKFNLHEITPKRSSSQLFVFLQHSSLTIDIRSCESCSELHSGHSPNAQLKADIISFYFECDNHSYPFKVEDDNNLV